MILDNNKVYVVLKTVTTHVDGESFSATVEGVYTSLEDAECKKRILEQEFHEEVYGIDDADDDEYYTDDQYNEDDDPDDYMDEDAPECEIEIIEQRLVNEM